MLLRLSFASFEAIASHAVSAGCNTNRFIELSCDAVTLYRSDGSLGEYIAAQMVSIAYYHGEDWSDETKELVELFMDLEVPPSHVVGGKAGARRGCSENDRWIWQNPLQLNASRGSWPAPRTR